MSAPTIEPLCRDWQASNHQALSAALTALRRRLEAQRGNTEQNASAEDAEREYRELAATMSPPPALETITALFGLSKFERVILLLCAGVELDASFPGLCAAANIDVHHGGPTFGIALSVLPEPHWSALAPDGPLRFWRLIELAGGGAASAPLTTQALRIDERILHYLAGIPQIDERLAGVVERAAPVERLTENQEELAERIASAWKVSRIAPPVPSIQLHGPDPESTRLIAARACAAAGLDLYLMPAAAVPAGGAERHSLEKLWQREAALSSGALLLECDGPEGMDAGRYGAILAFIEAAHFPLIVSSRDRLPAVRRRTVALEVARPSSEEQSSLWRATLGDLAADLDGSLGMLTSQFNLPAHMIHSAAAQAQAGASPDAVLEGLWDACRSQASARLDDLAERVTSSADWDDLVLPETQKETLREIAAHVRQRSKVYEAWGFGHRNSRGLGISALFAGTSGTGKTMAAEVLAAELRLDLYRIDVSSVVSKYIGETEKNLRRIFDAAEAGGAILLFDEADSIFGKRSEVKDSHDRYANIEVSYLLQRMECYRGLAVLTTNMKAALDPAFLRRIRFVLRFPFPDAPQRVEIWRRVFPSGTPTHALDFDRLGQLNVAGGNIRNIALNSAFLAAEENEPVGMSHILRAARSEYAKLDRTLTDAESSGWE
jgi:AAA+ superfamily predicted ATPase